MLKKLVILISYFLLANTHAKDSKWTVMIYWAVDNDLYNFSIPYLAQFEQIPANDKINLYLEYDYPDSRPTERFHNFNLIEKIGEKNSADPNTLINFIKNGLKKYPAENYILIIASHGSNWSGVIEDATSDKYMSLNQLRYVFKTVNPLLPKQKFDLVVFDACRMNFLETLYKLGNYIPAMIGSAFDVNGFDHYQPLMKIINEDANIHTIAQEYIRTYPDLFGNIGLENIGASFLRPNFVPLSDLESLLKKLILKDQIEIQRISENLHFVGQEFKDEDWGVDIIAFLKLTKDFFPELTMQADFLIAKFSSIIIDQIQTPQTFFHHGLGLTCPSEQEKYKEISIGEKIPSWLKICNIWRQSHE